MRWGRAPPGASGLAPPRPGSLRILTRESPTKAVEVLLPPPHSGSLCPSHRPGVSRSHLLSLFCPSPHPFRAPSAAQASPAGALGSGCPGKAGHAASLGESAGGASSPRRRGERGSEAGLLLLGPGRAVSPGPPPSCPRLFCSAQSLLHVVALFFPFFYLTLPLWIFSLTAAKVREREGRPGSWEGVGCVANPRSNTSLFWSLSPQAHPAGAQAAGLVAMEAVKFRGSLASLP